MYYLRAYDLCQDDPLICLSLALAYAHRAMQRQADNRHNSLAQAMALLSRYRKLRKSEVEVNYNVARFFHQLGEFRMLCLGLFAASRVRLLRPRITSVFFAGCVG